MKRILFLADSVSSQNAGIHFYGMQLIREIIHRFPFYEYHSISTKLIDVNGVQQHILPVKASIPFHLRLRQLTSVPKLANDLNPDVVIELAHFGPFRLKKHIQKMTVIHDLTAISHPEFHPFQSHLIQRLTMPGIIRSTDKIIVNSNFTKEEISRVTKLSKKDKIKVLYPTVKFAALTSPIKTDSTAIQKPYFLCVGTIEPRKNYVTVIKAFELIYQKEKTCRLLIIGRHGWKNTQVIKALEKSSAKKNIELLQDIPDSQLKTYYQHALAFISASHIEGFGLPIIEAAHFRLALIIANNSAQREIAQGAALLFKHDNVKELAEIMTSVMTDFTLMTSLREKSEQLIPKLQSIRQQQFDSFSL